MPARIQRKRTRGWKKPDRAVYVGRGTRWGNPWIVAKTHTGWAVNWAPIRTGEQPPRPWSTEVDTQEAAHSMAVGLYTDYLNTQPELAQRARQVLAGRDLMCWCAPGIACHADALLQLSNQEA